MIKATCSLILAFDHLKDPWSKPLGIPEHHQKVTVSTVLCIYMQIYAIKFLSWAWTLMKETRNNSEKLHF